MNHISTYKILEMLGKGSCGSTWLATNLQILARKVCHKGD